MLKGIDISQHQDTTPSLAGLSFVILRASIGGTKDTRYDTHYGNCRKAGVVTMAYHYGYPKSTVSIAGQVSMFLSVAANADFLWLDQEQAGFDDDEAQGFIDLVRKSRPIGLYHSACGFGGVRADAKWVADYRDQSVAAGHPMRCDLSAEFPNWDIWQKQGSPLDTDYLNPDTPLAELLRTDYVTQKDYDADVAMSYVNGQQAGYEQGVEAGELSGRRLEWDHQFGTTTTAGVAVITPGPRP